MGYMRHNAIIVTSFGNYIKKAHNKAKSIFKETKIPIIDSKMNGYKSFLIPPDGSKEGWEDSIIGDNRRAEFINWLNDQRFPDKSSPFDWVEVQYGDDEGETKIISHSDKI